MRHARSSMVAAMIGGALAFLSGPASGAIVPQRSIAGVSLGASEAKVRMVIGAPLQVRRGRNDFGPFVELGYRRLRFTLQGGRQVTAVTTTRPAERTASGVGVGTTERAVLRGIRAVSCATSFGSRRCTIGDELPGETVTVFFIAKGKVSRVTLGIVID